VKLQQYASNERDNCLILQIRKLPSRAVQSPLSVLTPSCLGLTLKATMRVTMIEMR
jgi:hypothetical protein